MLVLLIVLLVLVNIHILGSSRLGNLIRDAALQGSAVSLLALWFTPGRIFWYEWLFIALSLAIKGVILPGFMIRTLRETRVRREVEPYIGYSLSLLLGVIFLTLCLWLAVSLPLDLPQLETVCLAAGLFTLWTGGFLLVSRRKAVTQSIGYLSMENGIYALGLMLAPSHSPIVEMGILLDVFVGIFVMGILVFHINREFDHIDINLLDKLKD